MGSQHYFNPYTGKTFFSFLIELIVRFWLFIRGDLPLESLASDEIQILVLTGVAISSALVGTFLVLRKMTMLANSLSHTILVGIVIAFLMTNKDTLDHEHGHSQTINVQAMLFASLIMGLVTTFLTEILTKWARLQEDASIGIVFTSLFSIGVIAVTVLTRNAHIGIEAVMGNVDALQLDDCKLVYVVLAINIVLLSIFFKEYKITTFDAGLSRSFGISPTLFNYLLMIQVSATAIAAFRAVGVLMVLAFITGPALTARLLTHNLKRMLLLAALIGAGASVVGVALSRHILSAYGIALSTAGIVVCTILITYLVVAVMRGRHVAVKL
jgi:manganese/zinc/iron transport system permease protein